jgi:hypothetical protein
MIRPVGPKGGSEEFRLTEVPPGTQAVSKVARNTLKNSVFKATDFQAGKKISNKEEAKTAEDLAFEFFEDINEANAKP